MPIFGILTPLESWFRPFAFSLWAELRRRYPDSFMVNTLEGLDGCPAADCLYILSFEKLVPQELLKRNLHNVVVHSSELPEGRGWSPLTWQVLEGRTRIPNTLFEAGEKFDAGVIYLQNHFELDGSELLEELHQKQGHGINALCLEFAELVRREVEEGQAIEERAQIGAGSVYRRRGPEDSRLDFSKPLAEQFNLLRVCDNERFPAFFEHLGRRFVISIHDGGLVSPASPASPATREE